MPRYSAAFTATSAVAKPPMLPPDVVPSELAALVGGVRAVLLSPQYQQILHRYPAEVLDSPDPCVNPLPRPPRLAGADDLRIFARLVPVVARLGYQVEVVEGPGADPTTNGATWHQARLVEVNCTRSPLQQAKTLAHELFHVLLHRFSPAIPVPRRDSELLAETGAWVLLRRLGIDSGGFSFAFIAKYGSVREGARLQPRWALVDALSTASKLADQVAARMPAQAVA